MAWFKISLNRNPLRNWRKLWCCPVRGETMPRSDLRKRIETLGLHTHLPLAGPIRGLVTGQQGREGINNPIEFSWVSRTHVRLPEEKTRLRNTRIFQPYQESKTTSQNKHRVIVKIHQSTPHNKNYLKPSIKRLHWHSLKESASQTTICQRANTANEPAA